MDCSNAINITQGNHFALKVSLTRDGIAFPVELSEDVSCHLVSCSGLRHQMPVDIIDEGVVLVHVNEDLPPCDYIVDVTGKLVRNKWRTASNVLRITYLTEKGGQDVSVVGDTYDISLEVQMYKSSTGDDSIREHNEDFEAHPYIRSLISSLGGWSFSMLDTLDVSVPIEASAFNFTFVQGVVDVGDGIVLKIPISSSHAGDVYRSVYLLTPSSDTELLMNTLSGVEIVGSKSLKGGVYNSIDITWCLSKVPLDPSQGYEGVIYITVNSGIPGGGSSLTSDLVVSNPIGKYSMDDVLSSGTMLEDIFRGILSKTYYPSLQPPSVGLSYASNSLYKVGYVISAREASLSFNRGSISPQYSSASPYRSGDATDYTLVIEGASENYYNLTQDVNVFSVPELTRKTKGNIVLTGTVGYSAGSQPKDSDGNDYMSALPAGSKSDSKTIEFILPFYYGAVDTPDFTSLDVLTEDLSKKGTKTYKITTSNQYMSIVYDSSYGHLTSILDSNNFELIDGWSKTTKEIDGSVYTVWVSNGRTTDVNAKFTFKF